MILYRQAKLTHTVRPSDSDWLNEWVVVRPTQHSYNSRYHSARGDRSTKIYIEMKNRNNECAFDTYFPSYLICFKLRTVFTTGYSIILVFYEARFFRKVGQIHPEWRNQITVLSGARKSDNFAVGVGVGPARKLTSKADCLGKWAYRQQVRLDNQLSIIACAIRLVKCRLTYKFTVVCTTS